VIAGLFFLINGIVHVDDVSDSKLYLCPLIALMLISTIAMSFYAMIYDRIRRASTGREMQKFLDLLGPDSKFSKLIIVTMTLCIIFAAILFAVLYFTGLYAQFAEAVMTGSWTSYFSFLPWVH
jgi:hypothetical protein